MRAEEGDETIDDYAREAGQAKGNIAPQTSWWRRLWRSLAWWRRG